MSEFAHVHSFQDEFQDWTNQSKNQSVPLDLRNRSKYFAEVLGPLNRDFDRLDSLQLLEFSDLVENVQDALDELWRNTLHDPYPQERMHHLLDLIVESIVSQLVGRSAPNCISGDFTQVLDDLRATIDICEALVATLDTLTGKLWPHSQSNQWNGPAFKSKTLELTLKRFKDILNLRSSHEQLLMVLDSENALEDQDCFQECFLSGNPLDCSTIGERQWQMNLDAYRIKSGPMEERAGLILRRTLSELQQQPGLFLQECQKYKDLFQRPSVAKKLAAETEILTNQLISIIKNVQTNFKDHSYQTKDLKGKNVSRVISNITWARQNINRVEETDQIVAELIGKKPSYEALSGAVYEDLRAYEKDQFDFWVQDTQQAIDDASSDLALKSSGRLMELDFTSGKLNVNYGEHLVALVRDVRQFTAMGFNVPPKIQKLADTAGKYFRHSVVLKQVANFYNTIDQQMLASQQMMLLGPALEFERIVKNPKGPGSSGQVTWDDPKELEAFISKLQAAADTLTSENRKLRKFHDMIGENVVRLMSTDLVKNQPRWKEILNTIRSIINAGYDNGMKHEATLNWRKHWDYQLYKALEYQYRAGLEDLHSQLPEIKVDLVFKQQKLQFRPGFEEIRAKYYREMKKMINMPCSFKGLCESDIFGTMVQQNGPSLIAVYNAAENLFSKLLKVQDLFKDWILLGTVEIDDIVEQALESVGDWEMNFRVLKSKGKEAEQLPLSIKIDCITVSAAPVKATIDDHLQRLFDSMLTALRKSINVHLKAIEQFTNMAMDILIKKPQTMAEVGDSNTKHAELSKNKLVINSHFAAVEQKNKLLKTVAGNGVDTTAAKTKWAKLELMLESHEMMIKEQVDMLKSAIDGRMQKFHAQFEKFSLRWQQLKPKTSEHMSIEYAHKSTVFIKERIQEFESLENEKTQIATDCGHFGIDVPAFDDVDALKQELIQSQETWSLVEEYVEGLNGFGSQDWISFRGKLGSLEDYFSGWTEKLSSRPTDGISVHITRDMDSYRQVLPAIKFLRGDNWMAEHWAEAFHHLAIPKGVTLSELLVKHILDAKDNIVKNLDFFKDLNNRANGEVAIRDALQEIEIWGAGAVFSLSDYDDANGNKIQIIKDWKETLTQVGDNLSLLASLKDSPYYKNFIDKASTWEKRLFDVDEYLRQLNGIQRKWVYLEPIFSRGALPSEQSRFSRIDSDFRSIMQSISSNNRVVSILSYPNMRQTLSTLSDQLERSQKALNEFLEEKRSKFARFYFIGDEDLLEILGQATNPLVIQSHLKKLFAGVHSVVFDKALKHIVAMKSIHGETVGLKAPVKITDNVEVWLQDFADEMKATLAHSLGECLKETNIFKYPTEIIACAEYIHFTANVESILKSGGTFTKLISDLKQQLEKLAQFNLDSIQDKTEREVMQLRIKYLILDVIHFTDVAESLEKHAIKYTSDWEWQRQLRVYMTPNNKCLVRMHDAEFDYSYEYQGIPPKLVHTELTDKCYLTLTQAMASGFGGNPFGPAGTGKTESVKALGVLLGRQVLVFNCDEGIDYKSMGRIFVGLVKCGAWGCFDEFNRLEEAVLSAVSQQIQVIQAALKNRETKVSLLGREVDLDANSGIFVTLNPAGKGYGGRQKLPDNLKQLFRSVAMTHPDNELIAEVILFAEGFKEAKVLGRKVVSIFSLSKQFLSHQQHYDWGLRPLKAILGLAGKLLQKEQRKGGQIDEIGVVVKALTSSILSKLTFMDSKRFRMLVNDLFPGTVIEDIFYESLAKAVKEAYDELGYIFMQQQAEKVYQLYEACHQRMGVVLVGPSGSGKSTIWKLLQRAWIKMGQKLSVHRFNPKAVDRKTLLGNMDLDTREWTDGILTFASRQAVKEPIENHTWIICDGDVDPVWVESLNSVLDDNRLLTMPNGERIQFGPNVNFIFETHNLIFASPATVSRMGMIYLSDETLDFGIMIDAWVKKQPKEQQEKLKGWISDYFLRSLKWIWCNAELVVETTKLGLVLNGLSHLSKASDKTSFLVGLVRGLGANLSIEKRQKFAIEIFGWASEPLPDPKRVLDYYPSQKGRLEQYDLVEPRDLTVKHIQEVDQLPVVETVEIQRGVSVIQPWLQDGHPFLVVGPEGSGKSTLLRHCFSKLKSANVAVINCSAQTNSKHVLQKLSQFCIASSTVNGRTLRPKDCEVLILYLKDLNLPKPDKYDTVELIQFLQQLLTYKGFFDQSLEWVSIENIQIVGSLNPPSTVGRHKLSTRFTSVVRVYSIAYPEQDNLVNICKIMLQPVLDATCPGHKTWSFPKNILKLAGTIVKIYAEVAAKFTTDIQPHYGFNPRDISRLVIYLSKYTFMSQEDQELIEIIAYECQRLYQDRLVNADARQKFQTILYSVLRGDWNYEGSLTGSLYQLAKDEKKSLVKINLDDYGQMIAKQMQIYERDVRHLNLTLFPELLQQMAYIERILSQPGGSALLCGLPGVPFTSLVTLASHSLGYKLFSPKISRNYNYKAFLGDLKQVLQQAGGAGEDIVLLVEDFQMMESQFLEIINSLLSGAEASNVYLNEELEAIYTTLKELHAQEGSRQTIYEFFVSRIRKYLHIVFISDAANKDLAIICQSNPALLTRCQIQWQERWSTESISEFAKKSFQKSPVLSQVEDRDQLIKEMQEIHKQSKGATDKHFMEFLGVYEHIYKEKKEQLVKKINYLEGGLSKLNDASKFVDDLSTEAKKQQIQLADKQKQADVALKQITESMVEASEQKKEMEQLSIALKEEEGQMLIRKQAVEKELAEVEPLIRAAKSAVGEIRNESLSEIRSLRAPPPAIRDVLEGVLRLMGNLDMSWNSMKGFLGQRTVKEEIMNFDVRNISKSNRDAVAKLLREKKESFEEAVIKRSSIAAAPLAQWVKANLQYAEVMEKVGPLEQDLQNLTKSLNESKARVEKLKEGLDQVDMKVERLRDDFGQRTREAETIRQDLERAMQVIERSQKLLEKLSGEGSRWHEQAKEIQGKLKLLTRDTMLSAAFMVYLAGAPEDQRKQSISDWEKICNLQRFDLCGVMSTESEQLVRKAQGLPSDTLSNENAIVLLNTQTVPLLIDPSGRAMEWLKTHLQDKKPEIVNHGDENFVRSLELAIRFGKTLIVQEVTQFDAMLTPLVRKEFQKQGPRLIVDVGEKSVDFNEGFSMYLISRRSNFFLPPHLNGYVNLINFTITRDGLAGQLLGVTLKHERPTLEVERMELLKKEDDLKLQLSGFEEALLRELASSQGNILENQTLIQSLNETKEKSLIIGKSLEESRAIQKSLDQERDKYLPLSKFGSAIYFALKDLTKVNPMYQFSLLSFLKLFTKALLIEADAQTDADLRVKNLSTSLQKLVFAYVSRALLKQDRQLLALHLIQCLHPQLFEANEWDLFIGNFISTDTAIACPQWIPEDRKEAVQKLMEALPQLSKYLNLGEKDQWSQWMTTPNCEQTYPKEKLSPFQKVLLVQALRPDRLLTAMSIFSLQALGVDSLSPEALNLEHLLKETDHTEPILFITTPGADPSQELREFASQKMGSDKFHEVSMGQGQGEIAIQLLKECASQGHWLFLQNVHLVIGWVHILEKELVNVKPNPSFRLWLTSEEHLKFPISLLESSLKITIEAPPGVKKNLQRIYDNWTPEFISQGSLVRAQALFALAWFHAVIQERRTYIPQGWNKLYEFSFADLRSSADVLTKLCQKNVQWSFVHGLLEKAIYGGRIDDAQDASKLNRYLTKFFSDDVLAGDKVPSRKLSKYVTLPKTSEHQAYLEIIKQIPDEDVVGLFGLPANIDRTLQKISSSKIVNQLLRLGQATGEETKFERERWSAQLAPFVNLWKKLTTGSDLIDKQFTMGSNLDPIPSFFDLEYQDALELVNTMNLSLNALGKVIRGAQLLTNDVKTLGNQLMQNDVPSAWEHLWEGPQNAASYIKEAVKRALAIRSMRDKTLSNTFFKDPIQLGHFLSPLTFLNALRQQTSRQLQRPMDSLVLMTSFGGYNIQKSSPVQISVEGLLIQGCLFDGTTLSFVDANDPSFTVVPPFQLGWVPKEQVTENGMISVPVYKDPSRESKVAELLVPHGGNASQWILTGIGFFVSE
ncbi:dynein heavy chain and region D6 of dynein motor-domain-containing protein [Gorgonomyces haynaldii]|nr:dynein heavy chain and region D6 of dynein motor-domain-containing protein [Gorgonomyces haynaldii]